MAREPQNDTVSPDSESSVADTIADYVSEADSFDQMFPKWTGRIAAPRLYETERPMYEPPHVNYKPTIDSDQLYMKVLFGDHSLHFNERCIKYERYDAGMQLGLVFEYWKWITRMVKDATRKENHERRIFFGGLCEAISEDWDEVLEETSRLDRESGDRQLAQISRGLGIPLNQEKWMLEDKRGFVKYGEGVHGWPQPLNIRKK